MIKSAGVIMSNYGAEDTVFWAAPKDVAQFAAQELLSVIAGKNIRYIVSEQISCNEAAGIIGKAIGKPALEWQVIAGERMLAIFGKAGMSPQFAKSLIEMNCRIADGSLYEDFVQHPSALGKEKLTDFAKEFAALYHG